MAVGASGRVVIDLDPETKAEIHRALKRRGLTLREWFLASAHRDLLLVGGRDLADAPATPTGGTPTTDR